MPTGGAMAKPHRRVVYRKIRVLICGTRICSWEPVAIGSRGAIGSRALRERSRGTATGRFVPMGSSEPWNPERRWQVGSTGIGSRGTDLPATEAWETSPTNLCFSIRTLSHTRFVMSVSSCRFRCGLPAQTCPVERQYSGSTRAVGLDANSLFSLSLTTEGVVDRCRP